MPQRFQYTPTFDGLRGIAILCVLLAHASPVFKGGWVGVDLFFVLSGYLITSLLQNEYYASGKISLAKFYARRALRLFPALLICVTMANVLWPYTPDYYAIANRLLATLAGLFYFTNFTSMARFRAGRSHDAVIRVYDEAGSVIDTHEHAREFKEW